MKKYLLTIVFMASLSSYAQLQNINWYFGENSGLSFTPDPLNPTAITTALTSVEGCASYSNQSGTLIFYTNGIQAFNANNTLMPNGGGLMGHTSSANSAIIIPKPSVRSNIDPLAIVIEDPGSLYLVTIDGTTGNQKGLYYSEVNLLTNNTAEISTDHKNIVLKDHNGFDIDSNYLGVGNRSEKITSAPHCNGIDYWLIACVGDQIYSYLVTRTRISQQPAFHSTVPINVQNTAGGGGQIKISPNNERIAVCYPYNQGQYYGSLALGSFNNATGEVILDSNQIFIDSPIPTDPEEDRKNNEVYGVEFSSNSNFVYFGIRSHVYRANANGSTSAQIQQISVSPAAYRLGFQRAVSGKIYVSTGDSNGNFTTAIINNPNDPVNYDFQENVFPTLSGLRCTFPQWIHWQTGNCPNSYTLSTPDGHNQPFKYQTNHHIITNTNYAVASNQNIHMTAANFIEMKENTNIQAGSIFLAEISPCGGCN